MTTNTINHRLLLLLVTLTVSAVAIASPDVVARPASPLADAAQKADWPRVAGLLAAKADPNATQVDGATAMHWAVQHDQASVVKSLLAAGANATAANRYGVSPLSLACVNGNSIIVAALLDAGADANTKLRGGETVLMTAARTGRAEPIKLLLQHGAAVADTDRKGQSALMWAAADGHAEAVEILIAAGADPNYRLGSGFTPFLFAARNGRSDVVRVLLKAGIKPNEAIKTEKAAGRAPDDGTSALILAVENGHFELAADLIRAGADPNEQSSGFTPLHALSWVRKSNRGDDLDGQPSPQGSGKLSSLEFVQFLVTHGAEVNAKLTKGAAGKGKLNLKGATPLMMAAKTADLDLMKLLIASGADSALTNVDGSTSLMVAAGLGCERPPEEAGTEEECIAAVEYLISLGGDVNDVDKNGETAMHGAAYKSLPKVAQFLANQGAKIDVWNQKNKAGWTPIMIAEGFRPGNFKPSAETLAALHGILREAGRTLPPPTPRGETSKPSKAKQATQ